MPAPPSKPAPTARQILARYHRAHVNHGAWFRGTRPDSAQVYDCSCGEVLVVKAAEIAKL